MFFWAIFAIFGQKIFFSETTSPIKLKLNMEVPRGDLSQIYSNCGEICIIVFFGNFFNFWSNFGQKIFFSETTSQIDLNFGIEIPRGVII